ncbi:F(420)H(2) dehydrogenase subunit M [uncultured archaeon]|nr:F(420)H(2) dehydrogenase subunit M [uncultured archaeon]
MILSIYAIVGFVALLLILLCRSHRSMNALSTVHSLAYFTLALYTLLYVRLPSFYLQDRYFFIDHLGIYEALIAAVLFFFASVYSKGYVEGLINIGELDRGNLKLFYVAFNLLLISVTYSFFSNNLALFWIFAELTTVFSAVLIVTLNAKKNIGAALKYVFMASTSMLFSFIGLIFLFTLTEHALGAGTLNWDLLMLNAAQLSPTILLASFVFIFIGMAAKSGIVPFHAWLPTAYAKAPSAISAILSGSVSSVGVYGIIRAYAILHQTAAAGRISTLLIVFGLASIAVAAFSMLSQINLKKLIAFSSIENTGLMILGIGLGTPVALFWVLFHKLAHALTKAVLFFSGGIMHRQYGSMHAEEIKDALELQPLASWGLILGAAAIIGMPPFAIFVSKLFLLLQAAKLSPVLLFVVLALLLVAAGAFAMFLSRVFAQDGGNNNNKKIEKYIVPDGMTFSIVALIVIIFVLGIFFPQYLSDLLNNIVAELGIK